MNEEQRRNAVYPVEAQTLEQKPFVGQMVHFFPDGNVDWPMAAIVTAVWGPRCVNLHVWNDGSSGGTVRYNSAGDRTSVERTRSKTDVQVWDFA